MGENFDKRSTPSEEGSVLLPSSTDKEYIVDQTVRQDHNRIAAPLGRFLFMITVLLLPTLGAHPATERVRRESTAFPSTVVALRLAMGEDLADIPPPVEAKIDSLPTPSDGRREAAAAGPTSTATTEVTVTFIPIQSGPTPTLMSTVNPIQSGPTVTLTPASTITPPPSSPDRIGVQSGPTPSNVEHASEQLRAASVGEKVREQAVLVSRGAAAYYDKSYDYGEWYLIYRRQARAGHIARNAWPPSPIGHHCVHVDIDIVGIPLILRANDRTITCVTADTVAPHHKAQWRQKWAIELSWSAFVALGLDRNNRVEVERLD